MNIQVLDAVFSDDFADGWNIAANRLIVSAQLCIIGYFIFRQTYLAGYRNGKGDTGNE